MYSYTLCILYVFIMFVKCNWKRETWPMCIPSMEELRWTALNLCITLALNVYMENTSFRSRCLTPSKDICISDAITEGEMDSYFELFNLNNAYNDSLHCHRAIKKKTSLFREGVMRTRVLIREKRGMNGRCIILVRIRAPVYNGTMRFVYYAKSIELRVVNYIMLSRAYTKGSLWRIVPRDLQPDPVVHSVRTCLITQCALHVY